MHTHDPRDWPQVLHALAADTGERHNLAGDPARRAADAGRLRALARHRRLPT